MKNLIYLFVLFPTWSFSQDINWTEHFGHLDTKGLSGTVYDIQTEGTKAYVAGTFGVKVWDYPTATWSDLGSFDGAVYTLYLSNGIMYAGGDFTRRIARWTGTTWTTGNTVCGGLDSGIVYAIERDGNDVFIGGDFNNGSSDNIIRCDTSTGTMHNLGAGTNGIVYALQRYNFTAVNANKRLFVGGSFTSAGGSVNRRIARIMLDGTYDWDLAYGDAGPQDPNTLGFGSGEVRKAFATGNTLYIAGTFNGAIRQWTSSSGAGDTPSTVHGGVPEDIYDIKPHPTTGELYLSGSGRGILKESGSSWVTLPSGINNNIAYATSIDSNGTVYVGGDFTSAGNKTAQLFSFYTTQPKGTTSLVAPNNGQTNVVLTSTLSYNTVPDALAYQVEVSTDNFASILHNSRKIATTSYTPPALQEATTYQWRVKSFMASGITQTTISTFTTGTRPLPFSLLNPAHNTNFINPQNSLTLNWQASSGADRYYYVLTNCVGTMFDRANVGTNTSFIQPVNTLAHNTVYCWYVEAENTIGTTLSSTFQFKTVEEKPADFNLINPIHLSIEQLTRPNFMWQAATRARKYTLQVATSPNFVSDMVFEETDIITTNFNNLSCANLYCRLEENTTYYWRVIAYNQNPDSTFSTSVSSFTTYPSPPQAFNLLGIANQSLKQGLTPLINWENAMGATHFRFQLATNATFSNMLINQLQTATQYQIINGQLNHNTRYYWRVWAINGNPDSTLATNATFWFETHQQKAGNFTLNTFPNNAQAQPLNGTVDWNMASFADDYRVQFALDSGFTNLVLNTITSENYFNIPNNLLSYDTQYFWRVFAKNTHPDSTQSAVFNFKTYKEAPANFNLLSLTNGSIDQVLNPTFTWETPLRADSVRFILSKNSIFDITSILQDKIFVGNVTTYTLPNGLLSHDTAYFWKVIAKNNNPQQNTASNATFRFVTTIVRNVNEV